LTRFATVHERLLHLFIVSRDLSHFAHLHPDPQPDGSFVMKEAVPPGEYMLFADFLPNGGSSQMVPRAFISPGARAAVPEQPPASREAKLETSVDGVRFLLKPEDVRAGREACLTLRLTDAKTGVPIEDLEPYLGAPAHMLIVRADLTDALHAHPAEIDGRGPTISFHPLIPADGVYKAWVQIQRGGKVITAAFVVTSGG